MIEVISNEPNK